MSEGGSGRSLAVATAEAAPSIPPLEILPKCYCRLTVRKFTSRTARHPDRDFYKCPKGDINGCKYWEWADGLGNDYQSKPKYSYRDRMYMFHGLYGYDEYDDPSDQEAYDEEDYGRDSDEDRSHDSDESDPEGESGGENEDDDDQEGPSTPQSHDVNGSSLSQADTQYYETPEATSLQANVWLTLLGPTADVNSANALLAAPMNIGDLIRLRQPDFNQIVDSNGPSNLANTQVFTMQAPEIKVEQPVQLFQPGAELGVTVNQEANESVPKQRSASAPRSIKRELSGPTPNYGIKREAESSTAGTSKKIKCEPGNSGLYG